MTNKETREKILNQYVAGKISMDEADEMLENVETKEESTEEEFVSVVEKTEPTELPPEFKNFRFYWVIPLLIGMIFTLWGSFGLYNQFTRNGLSFGFWMAFLPLFLGAAIITLAISSSKGHWIHVRVNTGQDEWPRKIAISLPLPIGLMKLGANANWNLNIDGFGDADGRILVKDLIEALEESDQPLIVHVDERGGEKVKVMIW